jgi:hypothetical protein
MKMNATDGEIVLCIAAGRTGHPFLEELARLGCRLVLLMIEEHRDAGWPAEIIDQFHTMPAGMTLQQITNTVTYLARSRKFARIIALDDANIEIAAALREHLRIPGMGTTTARYFSDKLAARMKAAHMGIAVPAFTAVTNYDELRQFMQAVPAPWLLTPRSESWGPATEHVDDSDQVWRLLDALGDAQSGFLLEQSIDGQRVHVDSLTADGNVIFSAVSPYRRSTSSASQENELVSAVRSAYSAAESEALRRTNTALLLSMRMVRGVTHTEFMRSNASKEFYFLQTSATVNDGCVADLRAETHGLNLWHEWARLEVASMRGERYSLPSNRAGRKALGANTEGQHRLA